MTIGPTTKRIEALDALRGYAILGILAVNAAFFAAPLNAATDPAQWPHQPQTQGSLLTFWVMQTFFEAKMISMFSMLFGVSIYLIGGERHDEERSPLLRRRLWWLLLFGTLHALFIWYGDILFCYAISGFIVLLARSWSARKLLTVGVAIYAAVMLLSVLGAMAMQLAPEGTPMGLPPAEWRSGYGGSFVDSLLANMREWATWGFVFELSTILFSAPLMLVGMGLFKSGVLRGEATSRTYLALIAAGALGLIVAGAFTWADIEAGFEGSLHAYSDAVIGVTAPLITLMYASLAILGLRAGGAAGAVPRLLQPVGRMAFTNYLTQSLIMTILFYGGRGPGWWGEVDRPGLAAIVVCVWAVQIVWSHLWLSRFAMGPFEWVWRRLTYNGEVKLSRPAPMPAVP